MSNGDLRSTVRELREQAEALAKRLAEIERRLDDGPQPIMSSIPWNPSPFFGGASVTFPTPPGNYNIWYSTAVRQ
jgi:hypothetical protein